MNEIGLRDLVPAVIGVLVRRGADFASAEDAVQDAMVEAVRVWPDDPPRDPKGWLVTVGWRNSSMSRGPTPPGGGERSASRAKPGPGPSMRWTTRSSCTSCALTRP